MFGIGNKFYDEYGNFNNQKILTLLQKAKKARIQEIKKGKSGFKNTEIVLFKGASKREVWQFINKFAIFINSGVDVKGALGIIIKQIKNTYLKGIVREIKENINHGININSTMNRYQNVFDPLTISLIGVAEKTGLLGKILNDLDGNLIENIELKGKIKGAMIYPLILLGLTIAMVVFMMVFIVPRITEAFGKQDMELPAITQFITDTSNFLINEWWKVIVGIIVLFIIFRIIKSSYYGRLFLAKISMKLPIFGYIVRQSNVVYFIKAFTTLLDAGVLLLESLKTSSKVVPNLAYKKEIIRIKNEVEFGLTISKSLGLNLDYQESIYLNEYFPEEFAYVVNTGEETGSISDSLKKIGKNYDLELKRYIGNLSTMMEPIIIVIVGVLVGTIVVGIMMPFFSLGKVAQNI